MTRLRRMTDPVDVIARLPVRIHELENGLRFALEAFRALYFEARPSEASRQAWQKIKHLHRLVDGDHEQITGFPMSKS